MPRTTRKIEIPNSVGITDDALRVQHMQRKYGDQMYRPHKLGKFNFPRSVKFITKRAKRVQGQRFLCWGCDLMFTQGFAYLSQLGMVLFCHKCRELAVPRAHVDASDVAVSGGKADGGK